MLKINLDRRINGLDVLIDLHVVIKYAVEDIKTYLLVFRLRVAHLKDQHANFAKLAYGVNPSHNQAQSNHLLCSSPENSLYIKDIARTSKSSGTSTSFPLIFV